MKTILPAVAAFAASSVLLAAAPFSQYQSIIDRKPFGPEPANFDPEAVPGSAAALADAGQTPEQRTAEEEQLAARVRVSILNVSPSGAVMVGFTDSAANPAESYYLAVGRSQNGWVVKSADPASETVVLEKGGVEVSVKLGESTGGDAGKNPKGRRQRGSFAAMDSAPAAAAPAGGGLARLKQRRVDDERKARVAAEKKRQAEEIAKAELEEKERLEAEEKRIAAEERAQQREMLKQIQEDLKRSRAERAASGSEQEDQNEADNVD